MSQVSPKKRREVIKRAGGFCEYCRSNSKFSESPFDIDHILPESKGGKSEISNFALACHGCNLFKSDKTDFFDAATDKFIRLFNPRTDLWNNHFVWTSDFTEMVGLTAIGRVTIEALKLNRESLINQRKALYIYGEHPPPN